MVYSRDMSSVTWLRQTCLHILARYGSLDVFCKKRVLKSFAKFAEKHLYLSLFFNKDAGLIFQITIRLGHSIFNDKVLDIETALALKALKTIESSKHPILSLKPTSISWPVTTDFWTYLLILFIFTFIHNRKMLFLSHVYILLHK